MEDIGTRLVLLAKAAREQRLPPAPGKEEAAVEGTLLQQQFLAEAAVRRSWRRRRRPVTGRPGSPPRTWRGGRWWSRRARTHRRARGQRRGSRRGRSDVHAGLVGLDDDDGVTLGEAVALGGGPGDDLALGHGGAERRHEDLPDLGLDPASAAGRGRRRRARAAAERGRRGEKRGLEVEEAGHCGVAGERRGGGGKGSVAGRT